MRLLFLSLFIAASFPLMAKIETKTEISHRKIFFDETLAVKLEISSTEPFEAKFLDFFTKLSEEKSSGSFAASSFSTSISGQKAICTFQLKPLATGTLYFVPPPLFVWLPQEDTLTTVHFEPSKIECRARFAPLPIASPLEVDPENAIKLDEVNRKKVGEDAMKGQKQFNEEISKGRKRGVFTFVLLFAAHSVILASFFVFKEYRGRRPKKEEQKKPFDLQEALLHLLSHKEPSKEALEQFSFLLRAILSEMEKRELFSKTAQELMEIIEGSIHLLPDEKMRLKQFLAKLDQLEFSPIAPEITYWEEAKRAIAALPVGGLRS